MSTFLFRLPSLVLSDFTCFWGGKRPSSNFIACVKINSWF